MIDSNTAIHPNFFNELIESRFISSASKENAKPISDEFFMDLLCAFHDPAAFSAKDFQSYPLPLILLYLRQTHELYMGRSLQEITTDIRELTKKDIRFEKLEISLGHFFQNFSNNLEKHIQEEEDQLFPYIDALISISENKASGFNYNQKKQLVNFLLHHDDSHEEDLSKLIQALRKSPLIQDSFALRILVNKLSIFELDLRIHSKMEEEVLMPMAVALEQHVLNK